MKKISIPFKAKFQAAGIHFSLSVAIFLALAAWIYWVLYPSFYFTMSGGEQGLRLMLGVDVVLGPLLTFLIFNPHKKMREIILDLVLVGMVQFAALGYGLHVVYREQPKLLVVYDKGTAAVLNLREIEEAEEFKSLDSNQFVQLEKVPFAVFVPKNGQPTYESAGTVAPVEWEKFDSITRGALDETAKAKLATLEQQHGKLYVIAAMGKYQGKFIALDKQLKFVAELSTQSME
ncbi:hypothetical protein [Kingella negevensis]|uniref:hypothetical protein n=1 Tax=Kingella negevensis TaxID=1522312 RepID=UPI000693706D|nr:hypothetical protein [Kingella negevensis]MDK4689031.1 hypothetical protein [Kingella negevensis]WII90618.1 hypothetical protein QEO93_09325 [Kingella negevensis]